MQTTKNEIRQDYSAEMQEAFYAEDLEERFELAAAFPNLACWITNV
ncbi:MAG TPA: hypothetical protein VKA49_16065 [Flavitalea sp.]|nr:hypothetical protein [Flavitalea sp.]